VPVRDQIELRLAVRAGVGARRRARMIGSTNPAARNGHHRWSEQMEKIFQLPWKP
jgi:hypothetical protein